MLKSGPVSQVAPRYHSRCCHSVHVSHSSRRSRQRGALTVRTRFTPLLEEDPGEVGIEVELGGIGSDGSTGISGVVNVSSALGIGFHLANPVLTPHGPVWHPEHLHLLPLQLVVQARYSSWIINSFYFSCVEVHLSLFCSLSTVTIHRVCPACCLDPGATILRMCQVWMEYPLRDNFSCIWHNLACIRTSSGYLLRCSCSSALREWWFIPTQYLTWNIKQYISQITRAHRVPLIPCKSSDVVTSGITFTALDLIPRPFSQPRAQVPPLRHDLLEPSQQL